MANRICQGFSPQLGCCRCSASETAIRERRRMDVQTGLTGCFCCCFFVRANLDRNCCVWNGEEQSRTSIESNPHPLTCTWNAICSETTQREHTRRQLSSTRVDLFCYRLLALEILSASLISPLPGPLVWIWAKCLYCFFLFVCFDVGIHSCLPQLGLWNFKIFSPRSTVVLNFYLVQNFDISKIKRHLKNLWHSAAKIVFVVGQTECNTQRCVPDFIVECFNFIVFSQIAYLTKVCCFSLQCFFICRQF